MEDEHLAVKDCKVILEYGPASTIHVYLQPKGDHKHLLCSMDHADVQASRTEITDKLKHALRELGFPVVWSGPSDGEATILH
jgi:hypothetical protein